MFFKLACPHPRVAFQRSVAYCPLQPLVLLPWISLCQVPGNHLEMLPLMSHRSMYAVATQLNIFACHPSWSMSSLGMLAAPFLQVSSCSLHVLWQVVFRHSIRHPDKVIDNMSIDLQTQLTQLVRCSMRASLALAACFKFLQLPMAAQSKAQVCFKFKIGVELPFGSAILCIQ